VISSSSKKIAPVLVTFAYILPCFFLTPTPDRSQRVWPRIVT